MSPFHNFTPLSTGYTSSLISHSLSVGSGSMYHVNFKADTPNLLPVMNLQTAESQTRAIQ